MSRPRGLGDVLLEPPLARHRDVVPATEDRSYIIFIAGAMVAAIGGGFVLAVLASLASAGLVWEDRAPWIVQAHGWAQLAGWAGLFVAGMGFRLLPRFAGLRPLARRINLVVFAFLFAGVAIRAAAEPAAGAGFAPVAVLVGQLLWSVGAAAFTAVVWFVLLRGRGRDQPWWWFAFAGAAWWLGWLVIGLAAAVRAAGNDAYVPHAIDDGATWVPMLGAIGNFIWAVQSRSVPIFFGRKTPTLRRALWPGLLLNAGVALRFAAGWADNATTARLGGAGFVLSGAGIAWLAPVAGSCWGRATRLRPRARAASRFVLAANLAAVLSGALLVWAGGRTLVEGGFAAAGARDAARHAFGLGVITLLIVGMAQLVAPFFALRRVESAGANLLDRAVFWLLVSAAVLRIVSGLLLGHLANDPRMHLNATAGTLAWAGLVLFAVTVARALRSEPGIKETLAGNARPGGTAGR